MSYSGIGGQAVMEGVMMRNQDRYAVAVRTSDREIVVEQSEYKGITQNKTLRSIPLLRGVISFVESLALGMSTLTYSASLYVDEEDPSDPKDEKSSLPENIVMGGTVAFSVILAVAIFMVLPYLLSLFAQRFIASRTLVILIEGAIRLAIFIGYVALISLMPDIRRVFMYHGAEHKCINCIENGMELSVENVRKSSRHHKRCGTSFLILVMLISIIFFLFIRVDNTLLRLVMRLVLIPVIAGVSYEFIRLAGKSDNIVTDILSAPGMWLQNLTTREPDDDMIEVGIASVEAVFDWRSYIDNIRKA